MPYFSPSWLKLLRRAWLITCATDTYSRVMAMNLIQNNVDDFIPVVLTRASWSRRRCFIEEEGETVIGISISSDEL
jgi:hypothetical protein